MRPPDPTFADPRLATLYDGLDGDRSGLDAYAAIAEELKASRIIDIGCGTGSLAIRLAALGREIVGFDPAEASLDAARRPSPVAKLTRSASPGCTATPPPYPVGRSWQT